MMALNAHVRHELCRSVYADSTLTEVQRDAAILLLQEQETPDGELHAELDADVIALVQRYLSA